MSAFEKAPPSLSSEALETLAADLFGVKGQARPLASERDQNARIDGIAGRYVLKIANAAEDPMQIGLQNAALLHLEAMGFPGVPKLIRTVNGQSTGQTPVGNDSCIVRMVSWLDGPLFSAAPRSLTQLSALGRFMGRLTNALQGFGHPAANRGPFLWSLDHVAGVRDYIVDIADDDCRRIVTGLFDRYDRSIAPHLPALRASVLHQDANDNNIITDPGNPEHISGLIDFGDMCFGRTINELAITLAYALLDAADIYSAARAVIAGYVAEFPIAEMEAEVLYDLMRMRLAASICISSHQSKRHPENTYLLVSQTPARQLLARLDRIDPELMKAVFRSAAGYAATPCANSIRGHLASATVRPMFHPPLDTAARVALLTDGTHADMPAFSDRRFDAWFAAQRPAGLPGSVAFYGFGPYGEARSVYATDQFADAASPERRTRHLGIDVFAPAMTPVHAPLHGKVAYVTYNADPLDYGNTLILEHRTADGQPFWTLYGHLAGTLPDLLSPGQPVRAGDLVAHLGDWPENGGWAPHLHFQVMTSLLEQDQGNFFGVGHDSLWDVWSDICIDPNLILRLPDESFRVDPETPDRLLERRARAIGPSLSISYAEKLKMVRGDGPYLIDHTGRKFLDAVNNITHVG
ncbi:MAG: phosphotransferase, partial [Rhodobacteraceae bacterium]|nr:phosphotransferase [Paracoccaceae bacterium]